VRKAIPAILVRASSAARSVIGIYKQFTVDTATTKHPRASKEP
jgi:hypothetical protein